MIQDFCGYALFNIKTFGQSARILQRIIFVQWNSPSGWYSRTNRSPWLRTQSRKINCSAVSQVYRSETNLFWVSGFLSNLLRFRFREIKISWQSKLCSGFPKHILGVKMMKFSKFRLDKIWTESTLSEQLLKSHWTPRVKLLALFIPFVWQVVCSNQFEAASASKERSDEGYI